MLQKIKCLPPNWAFIISMIMLIIMLQPQSYETLSKLKCKRLPNGCRLKSYKINQSVTNKEKINYLFVCKNLNDKFSFNAGDIWKKSKCNLTKEADNLRNVYYRLRKPTILDSSFDILDIYTFINTLKMYAFFSIHFKFRYIKGFDLNSFGNMSALLGKSVYIGFYFSSLNFYSNGRLIKSCDQISNETRLASIFHKIPRAQLNLNRMKKNRNIFQKDNI